MGALADLSDYVNRATGGSSGTPENLWWFKDSRVAGAAATAPVAGRMTSLWQYDGIPSAGVAPGAVAVPDNTTAGGLKQIDPGGGRQKWITGVSASASAMGVLVLYDRLLHISGLDGTNVGAQAVGGALTRYTNGLGNQIWVEINTIIGATGTTITADYTDQAGGASTTVATAIGGTGLREAQRFIPLPLAAGDTGVQGVTSVTLLATTGTPGDFGVVVAHPLASIPIPAVGTGNLVDLIAGFPAMVECLTDACLAWAFWPNTTTAVQAMGSAHFVEA